MSTTSLSPSHFHQSLASVSYHQQPSVSTTFFKDISLRVPHSNLLLTATIHHTSSITSNVTITKLNPTYWKTHDQLLTGDHHLNTLRVRRRSEPPFVPSAVVTSNYDFVKFHTLSFPFFLYFQWFPSIHTLYVVLILLRGRKRIDCLSFMGKRKLICLVIKIYFGTLMLLLLNLCFIFNCLSLFVFYIYS